ncbi:tetratricopeptide repeat protein [Anatilimnocola sp. NA78]|uniref:tetratricopeptide repeat protein n=1 Tax=Anatilimnocola sp. NA78 TaxID=3415683 RepID=UPI003CE47869
MDDSGSRAIRTRFEQAGRLASAGQWSEAAALYAECVSGEPANADFACAWLVALERAPAPQPLDERASSFAALSRLAQDENWDQVLLRAIPLLQEFPRRVELLKTIATAAASLGHFEAADCYLEVAVRLAPDQADVLRQRAKLLAQLRRYDEALSTWMNVERVSPEDAGAAGAIASLAIERSRRRNGLKRRSEDYRATEPKPRVRPEPAKPADRVFGSLAMPTTTSAPVPRTLVQELEMAVREFPSHPQNYLQLAPLYLERGRDQDAERMLNRGRAATDNHPQVVALWEEVAMKVSEERVALARQDAQEHPTEVTQNALAQALRERDKLEIAVFQSRSQRQPENLALQYELGVRLKRASKLREAIKHLTAALGDPIERAPAAFELGECLLQQSEVAQAMHYFRQAAETALAEQATMRKQALYQLGVLAMRMKLLKAAVRYLKELLRIDPRFRDAAQLLQSIQPAPGTNALPPSPGERRIASSTPMA